MDLDRRHLHNQDDHIEKASQVNSMHLVYGKASRTLAWLGRDDGHDRDGSLETPSKVSAILSHGVDFHSVFDEEINKLDGHDTTTLNLGLQLLHRIGLKETAQGFLPRNWREIDDFFNRAWFGRIWTTQEMTLAQNLAFMWGPERYEYIVIKAGLHLLHRFRTDMPKWNVSDGHLKFRLNIDKWKVFQDSDLLRGLCHGSSASKKHFQDMICPWLGHSQLTTGALLLAILLAVRARKASDDRDQLFGILGMLQKVTRRLGRQDCLIRADYELSLLEVETRLTRYLLEETRSLSVLSISDRPCDHEIHMRPSWRVRLGKLNHSPLLQAPTPGTEAFKAGLNRSVDDNYMSCINLTASNRLYVSGVKIGTISKLEKTGGKDLHNTLHMANALMINHGWNEETTIMVLLRVVIADRIGNSNPVEMMYSFRELASYMSYTHSLVYKSDPSCGPLCSELLLSLRLFDGLLDEAWSDRTAFGTDTGHREDDWLKGSTEFLSPISGCYNWTNIIRNSRGTGRAGPRVGNGRGRSVYSATGLSLSY